jgi:hypothetical protein
MLSMTQFSGFAYAGGPVVSNLVISSDTADINLRNTAIANGWDTVTPLILTVTINSGVYVYSSSTATPAMQTGSSYPFGSSISIINNGYIVGKGGAGGAGKDLASNAASGAAGGAGGAGGAAFVASAPVSITNNGTIGGGGGGGGGGSGIYNGHPVHGPYPIPHGAANTGTGGGGGAGNGVGGVGGTLVYTGSWPLGPTSVAGTTTQSPTFNVQVGGGTNGTLSAAGTYGTAINGAVVMDIQAVPLLGGAGGSYGVAGSAAVSNGGYQSAGGTAGAAVNGNSNISWAVTGTRLGSVNA